jgi:excisionase family DNA binding protein
MRSADGENKKPPARITVAVESRILASREEAAQMLSISQRALDYLIATRRLPTRRIGGRVLIPVSELKKDYWKKPQCIGSPFVIAIPNVVEPWGQGL